MKLECPNCGELNDITESDAGRTVSCHKCHQAITIPRLADRTNGDAVPPAFQSPQPANAPRLKRVKRGPLGCEFLFWLFIALAGGGFYYAMRQWNTSPKETFQRLVTSAQDLVQGKARPAPEMEEEEEEEEGITEERPEVTAKKDPLIWLIENRPYWPDEVTLRQQVEFPPPAGVQPAESIRVPAGTPVKVLNITPQKVEAEYSGRRHEISIAATDLIVRANVAMQKAATDAKQRKRAVASASPAPGKEKKEAPETIREASRDEISQGLGAMYTQRATTFRVFAPTARSVSVVFYDDASGDGGRTAKSLRQQPNGIWDATLRGDLAGKFYTYLLDEKDSQQTREVVDPYATNAVASSSRARITPLTTPPSPGPALASPTDAIVYEMHVRDFTIAPSSGVKNPGLYLGFTEPGTHLPDDSSSTPRRVFDRTGDVVKTGLDHLTELGVTHVELLPVQDFENDEESRAYNWGYITSEFFSPEGMFATNPNDNSRVRELKALVNALHARGIGVILDVVYNHTSGKCSLFSLAPEYYYRRGADGSLANGSGCGNEVKSEAPQARRLILDSLKYWTKEFGIDGFRFDLMALIDQDTIREADRELRKLNPNIVMFGEPWTGGTSPLTNKSDKNAIRQIPAGAFNDDFRNALKGNPDGNEAGWIEDGSKRDNLIKAMQVSDWFAAPGQSINYMTCHDNLVLWDKLVASMPNADDALRIETMKLGYLALLTSQGVPYIHGGEEFARSKGGNHNSFEAPDSVNQVDWELKRQHADLFEYVRDAIALRKTHPMFRLRTRSDVASRLRMQFTSNKQTIMFTIDGGGLPNETWKRACVVLNSANETDAEIMVPGGEWQVAMDEHGAVHSARDASPVEDAPGRARTISGKFTLRHKSGVVLYQQ